MSEVHPQLARVASVMQDPSAQAVARTYADAFLDASGGQAEESLGELGSFVDDVLAKVPDLAGVLLSDVIGRDDKLRLIETVVVPRAGALAGNFLRVLARHGRLGLLPLIIREAKLRHEARSGRGRVQVTSARALSDKDRARITQRLAESLPFQPILETRVDPALVGGIVIRVGDTVYDSSLATRVKQLRDRLRQRSLHEIQSGRDRFSHPEGD
jgi:F-type H+-transporting ATPase subunit delta